ncbi:MAG TPA: RNA polymerase subunit sigma-70 [Solirubrobacteraceae bacterium]|jgi:RNA polymerase sigma-70 factor (ECF subfamily)|nr:RNA polymerase subunit sigma-70 [Solirubrobacteraceae bacterium]
MGTAESDQTEIRVLLARAQAGDERAFRALVEPYRRALQVHCYRMLGSSHDAEDIVQETLLRAWRALERFEPRASVRTWLYRIATNACLDELERRPNRPEPVEPFPNELLDQAAAPVYDPAARYALREGMELALLSAIQLLPGRQRAVLILRDVLGWTGPEVATLLDSTVASVNSALQRARATIDRALPERAYGASADDELELLRRYLDVWNADDFDGLVGLLREDAVLRMPPRPSVAGARAIAGFLRDAAHGDFATMRLTATRANGRPAVVVQRIAADGSLLPHGILVLEVSGGRIAGFDAFIDARFLPGFGFPATTTAGLR